MSITKYGACEINFDYKNAPLDLKSCYMDFSFGNYRIPHEKVYGYNLFFSKNLHCSSLISSLKKHYGFNNTYEIMALLICLEESEKPYIIFDSRFHAFFTGPSKCKTIIINYLVDRRTLKKSKLLFIDGSDVCFQNLIPALA